ncbi:ATPase [Neisseria bacilliformis ATCC BAA-1200]|uniref:ATPase n=1 Tax=Neisseria bacilliformis ATCC BAA-1200 TaxID=888742 RepID=F2BE40_9NEIS|nr:ATPase [Neisseria bacilliformis ATCC BAA-1200]
MCGSATHAVCGSPTAAAAFSDGIPLARHRVRACGTHPTSVSPFQRRYTVFEGDLHKKTGS